MPSRCCPGAFITFSPLPLYRVYELAPRFGDWTPEEDQQLAGALMKVGNIPILWAVIAAVFVKTALQQNRDERRLGEVDEQGTACRSLPPTSEAPSGIGRPHRPRRLRPLRSRPGRVPSAACEWPRCRCGAGRTATTTSTAPPA